MNAIQLFIVVQVRSLLAHCPKNNLNICIQSASLYTGWEQMQRYSICLDSGPDTAYENKIRQTP